MSCGDALFPWFSNWFDVICYILLCHHSPLKALTVTVCDQLTKLNDVQSAMLLCILRCCYVPSFNHLVRTVHPDLLVHASTIHDSRTKETFSYLLGYDMVDDRIWHQPLPIRMGSFGMIPLLSVRQLAFVVSWANAFTELPF